MIAIYTVASAWWYSCIGSENGFVPCRQQAIIWTNVFSIQNKIINTSVELIHLVVISQEVLKILLHKMGLNIMGFFQLLPHIPDVSEFNLDIWYSFSIVVWYKTSHKAVLF